MTYNDLVRELDISIRQDGHEIYIKADMARVIKKAVQIFGVLAETFPELEENKSVKAEMRSRLQGTEIDGTYIDISGDGTVVEQICEVNE